MLLVNRVAPEKVAVLEQVSAPLIEVAFRLVVPLCVQVEANVAVPLNVAAPVNDEVLAWDTLPLNVAAPVHLNVPEFVVFAENVSVVYDALYPSVIVCMGTDSVFTALPEYAPITIAWEVNERMFCRLPLVPRLIAPFALRNVMLEPSILMLALEIVMLVSVPLAIRSAFMLPVVMLPPLMTVCPAVLRALIVT